MPTGITPTPVPVPPGAEQRFAVHALFSLPDLTDPELGIASVQVRAASTVRASYFDTTDLRLAREGITVRHRSGEGTPTWVLTLPAGEDKPAAVGRTGREEVTVAGPAREVPAELRELLVAWLRGGELAPVATLRTTRERHVLCGAADEELAEVVDDTVSVLEGRRVVSRFREVEIESVGLGQQGVDEVRRRLAEAGASAADPLPTVVRALGPQAVAPSELPAATPVRGSDPAAALVASSLRINTRRLLLADIGVRRQQDDAVHQMRVACRRMRSDLKTFRPLVEPLWGEALRAELAWLAGSLGDARDLEVLRERLRSLVEAQSALPYDTAAFARFDDLLARREQQALTAAAEALRSERYLRLLDVLIEAAREPIVSPAAEVRCTRALPPLVRIAWAAMAKRARKLSLTDPDDDWHEARIKAKQARYAADATAGVLGKPAVRIAAAAKAVQEVLGEHQDAAIAAERVLALAVESTDDPALCLVAGRLVEANRCSIVETRRSFEAVWKRAAKAAE